MTFPQQIPIQKGSFNLSVLADQSRLAGIFVQMVESALQTVLANLDAGTLNLTPYSWDRQAGSRLTNLPGIYLLINLPLKKVYLGGTHDLAARKSDYKQNLNKPDRHLNLPTAIRNDIQNGKLIDFFFIPLVSLPMSRLIVPPGQVSQGQQIATFLDSQVEQPILQRLLAQPGAEKKFYNQKTLGKFTAGNPYGGSPQSGSPSKAVMFGNYAWESKSGAANSLGKSAKTIRNYTQAGKFTEITDQQYNSFSGTRISNKESKTFFENKDTELKKLKQDLGM